MMNKLLTSLIAVWMLAFPAVASPQFPHSPYPPMIELTRIIRPYEAGADEIKTDQVTVYFNSAIPVEEDAAENMERLLQIVMDEGFFTVDGFEKPLEVYILSYGDYVELATRLEQFYAVHYGWRNVAPPEDTRAMFLPVLEYQSNVILTHTWDWGTLAHELSHIMVMRQWHVRPSTTHEIVNLVANTVFHSQKFRQFLDDVTEK